MWKNQTGDCTCPGRKSVVFVVHVPSLNNYQVFPGKGGGRISYLVWSSRDRSFTFNEATTKQFGVCIKINFLPCTKSIRKTHHTLLASFFTYQQLTKLTMCRNLDSKATQIRSLTPKLVVFWAFLKTTARLERTNLSRWKETLPSVLKDVKRKINRLLWKGIAVRITCLIKEWQKIWI